MTRKQHIDLDMVSEVFAPEFTVKQVATKQQLEQLLQSGYRFPSHHAKPPNTRPFVAWDGEGITYVKGTAQDYVLFGASTGDRLSKASLTTEDCLNLLCDVEYTNPDAIHVGFALQYDVNQILCDLSRKHLWRLYNTNHVKWGGYSIEYRPGKWLSVRKHDVRIRLFDVFGFFQASFVKACESFLGKADPELVRVRDGKQARSHFTIDQLDTYIVPYWEAELRLLVRLMESLRDDLLSANIIINSWHGPGAVASKVLRTNNVHKARAESPEEVNRASQYAYAGGRFELFRAGYHKSDVWEYDIRSAYPSAIATLPNLSRGSWEHTTEFDENRFGVWRVGYSDNAHPLALFTKPQPLFYRDKHGNISYPAMARGWYWTPEAALVAGSVIEGWVFVPSDDDKPFEFVKEMYETRRLWKKQGNSAERALKLALNSLYGKMAQRVGAVAQTIQQEDQESLLQWKIPQWHQLEWAGYVTSMTRAKLWSVLCSAPRKSIIAVETDAIFSTTPLSHLDIGEGLGQWEVTKFDSILYLQSGMYYGHKDGELIERYRGFDKGSVPYNVVSQHLRDLDAGIDTELSGLTTRYVGLGVGLRTKATWRSWVTDQRKVQFGGGGKRTHVRRLCWECRNGLGMSECLHTLSVTVAGGLSYPHALPWLTEQEPDLRTHDDLWKW